MSKIVRRVRRDLREIADQAPISPAARDSILSRVDTSIDHSEREVVMLGKNSFTAPRRTWGIPVAIGIAAVAALAVAGIVIIRNGGDDVGEVATVDSVTGELTTRVSAPPAPSTTVLPAPESWSPILATTVAKTTPTPAACPAGTDPSVAGPVGQQRPHPRWSAHLAAAFDQHTGRIVYVDRHETWTFDVCTNRWDQINPDDSGIVLGPLVYDADSDVTVALNPDYFEGAAVYDANTNTWAWLSDDMIGRGDGLVSPMGAVYDPISGLIVTTHFGESGSSPDLWAYDVDTNTWSMIGTIPGGLEQFDFLGYSREIDRFILVGALDRGPTTALLDPRTGETTLISTDTPFVGLGWPRAVYGPAGDTIYVSDIPDVRNGQLRLCGFDTTSLTWTCTTAPATVPSIYLVFAAAVGDPINDRLILINGIYDSFWVSAADDVWAIDLGSGEWTQILELTDP